MPDSVIPNVSSGSTKRRPDVFLYVFTFFAMFVASAALALLYWISWTEQVRIELGFHTVRFDVQEVLDIPPETFLAGEFQKILPRGLVICALLMAVVFTLKIPRDYDICWWLKAKPKSARLRVYCYLALAIGVFSILCFQSSAISLWLLDVLGISSDSTRFYGVIAFTLLVYPTAACAMLLGFVGFARSAEESRQERNQRK